MSCIFFIYYFFNATTLHPIFTAIFQTVVQNLTLIYNPKNQKSREIIEPSSVNFPSRDFTFSVSSCKVRLFRAFLLTRVNQTKTNIKLQPKMDLFSQIFAYKKNFGQEYIELVLSAFLLVCLSTHFS